MCMCMCVYIYIYIYIYIHTYIYRRSAVTGAIRSFHVCIPIYMCMYVCMYVFIYLFIYITALPFRFGYDAPPSQVYMYIDR